MKVVVQPQTPGAKTYETQIDRVGPTMELVPPPHRHDPTAMEWGIPIRAPLPHHLKLMPGQLVYVSLQQQG